MSSPSLIRTRSASLIVKVSKVNFIICDGWHQKRGGSIKIKTWNDTARKDFERTVDDSIRPRSSKTSYPCSQCSQLNQ